MKKAHAIFVTINEIAQNKPTLIVLDLLAFGVPEEAAYSILLKRGIFKWLACREDLIRLKDCMKKEIRALNRKKSDKEKGYLKALEKYRKEIRFICHSPRIRVQTTDSKAQEFLAKWKKNESL